MVVSASEPVKLAPIAEHMPAISSSAWNTLAPSDLCFASSCNISVAGVIGYDPKYNGLPERSDAASKPHAVAIFPVHSHVNYAWAALARGAWFATTGSGSRHRAARTYGVVRTGYSRLIIICSGFRGCFVAKLSYPPWLG